MQDFLKTPVISLAIPRTFLNVQVCLVDRKLGSYQSVDGGIVGVGSV
jgi:hypothetical protein